MNDRPIQDLVSSLTCRRILVLGDVMLDEYLFGEARRVSPEAPVPVIEFQSREYRPGGAGNVAANVAALGSEAILAGIVGDDHAAETLISELLRRGIDTTGIHTDLDRPTTIKTRVIAQGQQVLRLDNEARVPLPLAIEDELICWIRQQIPKVDACIISDYAKGVVTPRLAQSLISLARELCKPVIVDPKGTDYAKYQGANVIKPNIHEAQIFLNREISEDADLMEAAQKLAAILLGAAVIITRGAQGIVLFEEESESLGFPTHGRSVYDVTGAGDTVAATVTVALACGLSLVQAVQLANLAAGIAVRKTGTAVVTLDELDEEIAIHSIPFLPNQSPERGIGLNVVAAIGAGEVGGIIVD